ncbi:Px [Lucerne transient streak virus]|uniref:Px n=1 Tax=Lucerne transient streak virus TaxID=12470 RepID=UPI0003D4077E|nr:Px [Lucerne transient streak virus]
METRTKRRITRSRSFINYKLFNCFTSITVQDDFETLGSSQGSCGSVEQLDSCESTTYIPGGSRRFRPDVAIPIGSVRHIDAGADRAIRLAEHAAKLSRG